MPTAGAFTSTTHSWPFVAWGMDIIGPFKAAMVKAYKYILAAAVNFSQRVKAIHVRDFTSLAIPCQNPCKSTS